MNSTFKTTFLSRKPKFWMVRIFLFSLIFLSWTGQGQQLETFIVEAIKNNPNIQAVIKQHAIATEKVSESNSLPDTQFSGGYTLSKAEMPMMQQGEFSMMQMLPWFGTISARSKYATAMADVDFVEIEIAKRKIAMAVSQSYFRLYEIARKQQVLDSNIQLLQVYERLALTSVEVGQASAVSVLRLQMRQNDLIEQKLRLQQDYSAALTATNKIMNREEVTDIAIRDSLTIPEKETEIDFSQLKLHPEITKYNELNEVVSQADILNKKESAPDFGIGVQYMLLNEAPNMLMPMATISIPIFNKKYKSVARQNKLKYEELEIQKQASENLLMTQLQTAIKSRNAARISLETQDKNIKQAQHANEILLKNYETGTINFNEVLDVQELQLKFQISRIEAIAAYFKQTSIINYFTDKN
ncbi:TolC family protein [Aequorivita marisscotiae]|uniref:TolC family protein n=1 Tax=Aequorivita marisscotiae TaxID=3040348 RepID=A0ABY8KX89_9FLAO|nr:TolC family protein [Aequorivita sp. Ant34-E75]WGF92436.1 TolC family protein [Aequorivita sp. Ant34-E75]